jgi:SOS response regulatory protein OraA/RecX
LLRWAAKIERDAFSERELRRNLRETKFREEDIDMIIAHLEHSGKMATEEISVSN